MSYASYRTAILSIAAEALDGEDVTSRISFLAAAADLDASAIAHEVDEAIDLIR